MAGSNFVGYNLRSWDGAEGRTFKIMSSSFTKQDTAVAKGIAICMMLWLHLFGFPERIKEGVECIPSFLFFGINFDRSFANIGTLCVSMFLFISGYGMYASFQKSTDGLLRRTIGRFFAFFSQYWVAFFVMVPIGLIFFRNDARYAFDLSVFLKNFLAFDWSYCPEWWFVQLYLLLIIASPVLLIGIKRAPLVTLAVSFILFLIPFDFLKANHMAWGSDYTFILNRQFVLVLGCVFARYDFFQRIQKFVPQKKAVRLPILILVLLMCVLAKKSISMRLADSLVAPLFIFAGVGLVGTISWLSGLMALFGKHSLYMWLVHPFFCYYYWQQITYAPKLSIMVFVWLALLSLTGAVFLGKIYDLLTRRIRVFLKH